MALGYDQHADISSWQCGGVARVEHTERGKFVAMTNCGDEAAIETVSATDQPEDHFVGRSVPVLFTSRRGLQLRKFVSVLHTGHSSYTVQFCDLERWSNHFKVSSVGLTPDSSITEASQPSGSKAKSVMFVRHPSRSQPSNPDNG